MPEASALCARTYAIVFESAFVRRSFLIYSSHNARIINYCRLISRIYSNRLYTLASDIMVYDSSVHKGGASAIRGTADPGRGRAGG